MSMQEIEPMQYLEDAEQVVLRATDPDFFSPESLGLLPAAALTLQRELRASQREVHWTKATLVRQTGQETVAGGVLRLGRSPGGARNYLNDVPVHAGEKLYLLTHAGWLSGWYEYRLDGDDGLDAYFQFPLPGARSTDTFPVSVRLPVGARLAWPKDIESRR